jgi:hypothetical protein
VEGSANRKEEEKPDILGYPDTPDLFREDVMSSLMKSVFGTKVDKDTLAGLAVSAGIFFVKNVIQKKGVSTNLKFLLESLLHNNCENRLLPEQAIRQAKTIAETVEARHLRPDRIAVDGVPGSGKSTLAKALADRLGMETVCLDHQNMDEPLLLEQVPAVYEHHRLLRTQDIDRFEVIIYLDQPLRIAKQHILQRERGAYLVDIMNFDLLKRIGDRAFALAEGPALSLDNGLVQIKNRPDKGFRDRANLAKALESKGVGDSRIAGLNKEQQLFLLVEGQVRKGFMAYVNPRAYEKEFFAAFTDGITRTFTRRKPWR